MELIINPVRTREFSQVETEHRKVEKISESLIYKLFDLMKRLAPIISDLEETHLSHKRKLFGNFDEDHRVQYNYSYYQGIVAAAGGVLGGVSQIALSAAGAGDIGRAVSSILSSSGQFGERALHAESTLSTKDLELIRSALSSEEPQALRRLDETLKEVAQEVNAAQRQNNEVRPLR